MKSNLTADSIKKMYGSGSDESKKKTKTESKSVSAKSSRDMVVIESDGKQHIVPTHIAFTELLREHLIVKNDLRQVLAEIKVLKDSMRKLIMFSNNLSESVENKVDKLE